MITRTVTVDAVDYNVAPLDWEQYESVIYDAEDKPLKRAKIGQAVKMSLDNATKSGSPNPDFVPAGHVLGLWKDVLDVSGLKREEPGEVPAAAAQ